MAQSEVALTDAEMQQLINGTSSATDGLTDEQMQQLMLGGTDDGLSDEEMQQMVQSGTTLQAGVKLTVPITDDKGNPITRALGVAGDVISAPFKGLWDIGSTAARQVTTDPAGSAWTVAKDAYALSPFGYLDTAVSDLLNIPHTPAVDDIQAAARSGLVKTARDIGQGVLSAPADIANLWEYVATGNKNPGWEPLFKLPDITPRMQSELEKEPLAGIAGGALPFFAAHKPLPATVLGTIMEPSGETPSERIANRAIDATQAGLGIGAAHGVGAARKAINTANMVKDVEHGLHLPKDIAKDVVKRNPDAKAVVGQGKKLYSDIQRTEKGAYKLTPEDTAGLTDSKGKVIKDPLVVGSKKDITTALQAQGHDATTADQMYQNYVNQRRSASFYEARVQADRDIMRAMGVEAVDAPTVKNPQRLNIMGGEQALDKMRKSTRVKAVTELSNLLNVSKRDALAISKGLQHPLEATGKNAYLTTRESVFAAVGALHGGRLVNTTPRAGAAWQNVIENVPKYQGTIADSRNQLNTIKDKLIAGLAGFDPNKPNIFTKNPITTDIADLTVSKFNNIVKNGMLADAMKGDWSRFTPEEITRLKPVVDELNKFNEDHIIPMMREIYGLPPGTQFDPSYITNSQRATQVHFVDLKKLSTRMHKSDYDALVQRFNANPDPKGSPMVLFGYYDNVQELVQHLKDNSHTYRRDMPWLYDKKGNINQDLIVSETNKIKALSDLEYNSKLDESQVYKLRGKQKEFVEELVNQTGMPKADADQLVHEYLFKGNQKNPNVTYRRFVGSLIKNQDKLLTRNVDPFKAHYTQMIDLAKRKYLGPVINGFIEAQEQTEKLMRSPEALRDPVIMSKLKAEAHWYKDMEAVYRNTPSEFDMWASEMFDKVPMPKPAKDIINNIFTRRGADAYAGIESILKLGLNGTASLFNIYEAMRSGLPELNEASYAKLFNELGLNVASEGNPLGGMMKSLVELYDEAKAHPAASLILNATEGGIDASHGFAPEKLFGSRTAGSVRDFLMFPFSKSTTIGKLISFKIFKTLGEQNGLAGKALDDFVVAQMAKTGTLTDLSQIPLQKRSSIAKPMMLFKTYMIRLADAEMSHWGKILSEPTTDNIIKAATFSLLPAILLGVQTSPSLMLGVNTVNTLMGIKDAATGEESKPGILASDRASGGFLTGGIIGTTTDIDTDILSSDLGQVLGIDQSVPVSELKSIRRWYDQIQLTQKSKLGGLDASATISDATGNLLRDIAVIGNRAASAIDIYKTGEIRDRRGTKLVDAPDKETTALAELFGFYPKQKKQEQLRNRFLQEKLKQINDIDKFLDDRERRLIQEQPNNEALRLGDIQKAKFENSGGKITAEKLNKLIFEKDLTKRQQVWLSLPIGLKVRLLNDPEIRPLVENLEKIPTSEELDNEYGGE